MKTNPSVTIVGAGSLGGALAPALHKAGFEVHEIVYRSDRKRAMSIAKRSSAEAAPWVRSTFDADLIWLCVGDAQIEPAAQALSSRNWKGKAVFHSSGALSSEELRSLKSKGAAVASVHPMMSFVRSAESSFKHVPFALEGDATAKKLARAIARDLGGTWFELKKSDKPLYHALGAWASPLLIAHLAAAEKVGKSLGLSSTQTRRVIGPILQKTLANYLEHGAAAALSGPLVRGDVETLRRNLRALQRVRGAEGVFRALVKMAVLELPVKESAAILGLVSK